MMNSRVSPDCAMRLVSILNPSELIIDARDLMLIKLALHNYFRELTTYRLTPKFSPLHVQPVLLGSLVQLSYFPNHLYKV